LGGEHGEFAVLDELAQVQEAALGRSSEISDKKTEICLSSLSMLFSLPVLRRVVMARVAMLRLASAMRPSRSSLHLETRRGLPTAT